MAFRAKKTRPSPRPLPSPSSESPRGLRLAAIDLGTNSFHMIIVELLPDTRFVVIDRAKEMIRIGEGSITTKQLSDSAKRQGIETLLRFRKLAEQRGVEGYHIVAYATSAIREAKNGSEFMEEVRNKVGIRTRVISGEEEARLIYLGVRNGINFRGKKALIVDAGGGSVEFVIGSATELKLAVSKKLGVARIYERFVTTDPLSLREAERMRNHFFEELNPIAAEAKRIGFDLAIASSGTAENLAAMIAGRKGEPIEEEPVARFILKQELHKLIEYVLPLTSAQRKAIPGLDTKRSDIVLPGLLFFETLFSTFDLKKIEISPFALREGIVIDYLSAHSEEFRLAYEYPDARRRSVMELAKRCMWDERRSRHIAELSLRMFDLLKRLHGFGKQERELLEYAALLHSVGMMISLTSHHKHSYYIIMNGELRGFTGEEIAIIANITRYYRKSSPKSEHENYAALTPQAQRIVYVLAAILRLANAFDRTHRQHISIDGITISEASLRFRLSALSDAEIEIWAAEKMTDMLQNAFKRTIDFRITRF